MEFQGNRGNGSGKQACQRLNDRRADRSSVLISQGYAISQSPSEVFDWQISCSLFSSLSSIQDAARVTLVAVVDGGYFAPRRHFCAASIHLSLFPNDDYSYWNRTAAKYSYRGRGSPAGWKNHMNQKILPLVTLLFVLAVPSLPLASTHPRHVSTTNQPLVLGYLDPEGLSGRIADVVERGTASRPNPTQTSTAFTGEANQEVSVEHFAPNVIISQTEPSIAVSPTNPSIVVAGYHDLFPTPDDFACSFSFSTNGGGTWTFGGAVTLVKPSDFCSDPALAADGSGNFYYAYLSVRASAKTTDVVVARSTDGGQTFPDFKVAAFGSSASFPDKEYIAVSSTGQIFVTYTDFHNGGNGQITLVTAPSFNAGFSLPQRISPQAISPRAISGSDPFIAADGTLYIAYADFTAGTGPLAIRVAKVVGTAVSTFTVASNLPSTGRFRLNNGDPSFGTVPGAGFRSNSFPSAAASPTGNLYVTWVQFPSLSSCTPDGTGRPPCVNADVFFSSSSAGPSVGTVWTTPNRVNDDTTTTDQFFPWLTVQPNGAITIIFGDKRLDPNNVVYNVFSTSSSDAGTTFSANIRVTDAASDPAGSTFIGDYFNDASSNVRVNAIWTDRRLGNEDIFASRTL